MKNQIRKTGIDRFLIAIFSLSMLVFILFCCLPAQARTIALVYDDSGSMEKKDRWVYANYAAQSLTALLRQDDRFYAVRMKDPRHAIEMDIKSKKHKSLNRIRKNWEHGGGTPYKAVITAAQKIQDNIKIKRSLKKTEQNWLIILTDGEFFQKGKSKESKVRKHARQFFKNTKGEAQVVFVLIGKDADERAPEIWKDVAPTQVNISSVSPQNLVLEMRKVAAMITGRDKLDIQFISKDNKVQFESWFPIRRLTVFEQTSGKRALNLEQIKMADKTIKTKTEEYFVESREGKRTNLSKGRLSAKITHIRSKSILPAGKYELLFNKNIESRSLQLHLEAAIDFRVFLYNRRGQQLTPSKNVYQLCQNARFQARIEFLQAGTKNRLNINPQIAKSLKVSGKLGAKNVVFKFDSGSDSYLSPMLKVPSGKNSLSVEAKYPGYFHLKSDTYTIKGISCASFKVQASSKANQFVVPYTFSNSKTPVPIAESSFFVIKGNKRLTDSLDITFSVPDIPQGLVIQTRGKNISRENPKVQFSSLRLDEKLAVNILRNRSFQAEKPKKIKFTVSSSDPDIHWKKDEITFVIKPQPRDIRLQPVKSDWNIEVDRLEEAQPIEVKVLQANGKPISSAEFRQWELGKEDPSRLSIKMYKDEDQGVFYIKPEPFLCSVCLTGTGKKKVSLIGNSPFPLEKYSTTLNLNIENISWWKKCRIFIAFIFLFLFCAVWLIGILKKPRFDKGSVITFQRVQANHIRSRPQTERLPGNLIARYLMPFSPEKKQVGNFRFKADKSKRAILIGKDQEKDDVVIDGLLQDRPWKRDLRLRKNTTLEERTPNWTNLYTYK